MTMVPTVPTAVINFAQGTVTAQDDAVVLRRFSTWNFCGIQITGTWTGTITFEATVDGATWVSISVTPFASITLTSTATAVGCWSVQNVGFAGLRARLSTVGTGSAVVTIKSLPSQA